MKDAYIIDGVRTPIGNYKGTLSAVRTDDLGAHVIKTLVERNLDIPKDAYDDVIMGCANQAGEDNRNVARMSALANCYPEPIPMPADGSETITSFELHDDPDFNFEKEATSKEYGIPGLSDGNVRNIKASAN